MKKLLTISVILFITFCVFDMPCLSQNKPFIGAGGGFNNSAPFHVYFEGGMEINSIVALTDFKQTFGINDWNTIGIKSGYMLRINTDLDEYLLPYVGLNSFNFPSKYEVDNVIKPSIGFRWQFYNVSTDVMFSNNFGFITIGWQIKELEVFK